MQEMQGNRMPKIICPTCVKEKMMKKEDAIYCSNQCAQEHYRRIRLGMVIIYIEPLGMILIEKVKNGRD